MNKITHRKTFVASIMAAVLTLIAFFFLIWLLGIIFNIYTLDGTSLGESIARVLLVVIAIVMLPVVLLCFIKNIVAFVIYKKGAKQGVGRKSRRVLFTLSMLIALILGAALISIMFSDGGLDTTSIVAICLLVAYLALEVASSVLMILENGKQIEQEVMVEE